MTLKTREIERSLLMKGFTERNSDHKYFIFMYNGKKVTITKISHSHSEIGDILISEMSKQLNMTKDFFKGFIECTKSESEYIQTLKDKRVL